MFKVTGCCFLCLHIVKEFILLQLCHCSAIDLLLPTFLLRWWQPDIAQNSFEMGSMWKICLTPADKHTCFWEQAQFTKLFYCFFPLYVCTWETYLSLQVALSRINAFKDWATFRAAQPWGLEEWVCVYSHGHLSRDLNGPPQRLFDFILSLW